MKKIIGFVAIAVCIASLFTSCGGKKVLDELGIGGLEFRSDNTILSYKSSERGMTYVFPAEMRNGKKVENVHIGFFSKKKQVPKNNTVIFKEGIKLVTINDIYGAGKYKFPSSCKTVTITWFGNRSFTNKNKLPKTVEKLYIEKIYGKDSYGKLQSVTIPAVKEIYITRGCAISADDFKFLDPNQVIIMEYHSNSNKWMNTAKDDAEALEWIDNLEHVSKAGKEKLKKHIKPVDLDK